jgi:hypothetical protein
MTMEQTASSRANLYQADDVKRVDRCITGAEWPSAEQLVSVPAKRLRLT